METLRHEAVYLEGYRTLTGPSAALPKSLDEVYNGTRLHCTLGYLLPAESDQQLHLIRTA